MINLMPNPGILSRNATIEDIAKALGISAMTVSRALNSHPQVRAETRRKVMEKAAEFNYRPNRWAQTLVTNRTHLLGLVVPDISHTFFGEITRGIQEVIEEHGYNLLLCNTGRDPKTEIREIDALLGSRVEGLIVASEQAEDSSEYFDRIVRQGVPFISIDRFFPKLNCSRFITDDHEAGRLATEHLIQLGHRKIGQVRGLRTSAARLRVEGYLAALRSHGIEEEPSWIVCGNFQVEESCEAAKFLMRLKNPPTAIVTGNDTSAFGVVRGCRELGLSVPGDVSVVGVGNVEGGQHPNPYLTTIHWDRLEMGREAARVLLSVISGRAGSTPVKKVFAPTLLVRESTAAPRNLL
jgi:DNA-binding LacI/PurR family transcriptional regulator